MLYDLFAPSFGGLGTAAATFVPHADVSVSDTDLVLTMDVPGLRPEQLDIQFEDGVLIVRGERRRPDLAEGSTWAHAERSWGGFERRFRIPRGVDPDQVTASLDSGVLSLIVPKPERLKPRTIEIRPGTDAKQLETANA